MTRWKRKACEEAELVQLLEEDRSAARVENVSLLQLVLSKAVLHATSPLHCIGHSPELDPDHNADDDVDANSRVVEDFSMVQTPLRKTKKRKQK